MAGGVAVAKSYHPRRLVPCGVEVHNREGGEHEEVVACGSVGDRRACCCRSMMRRDRCGGKWLHSTVRESDKALERGGDFDLELVEGDRKGSAYTETEVSHLMLGLKMTATTSSS
ncbi:Os04g0227666 [Oryza sativa Japonica Group]|uniref:Os04g0227666 protein n=1 Tax=Oryza sativa subsp. japonica TaxID=39947 RepID=A0A0P0W7P2_ORYSJ|nr:Os04g0227666 [Oryza sativa Japonica Group]